MDEAWLAGLMDGEGSVGIRIDTRPRGRVYLVAAVQIEMTCSETIERAHRIMSALGVQAPTYAYRTRNPKLHQGASYLRVNRLADIAKLASSMLPFSTTKRRQWEAMLAYATSRLAKVELDAEGRVRRGGNRWALDRPFSEEEIQLAKTLKALNARGPAAKRKASAWLAKVSRLPAS